MYEEYREPLPDLNAYLERIGLAEAPEPTPENLDMLVFRHQCSVPFDDLDESVLHQPVSVVPADLFDKIVVRRRGGFCFEQNALFCKALQGLGYEAWETFARVAWGWPEAPKPCTHCAVIVQIPGEPFRRFCDVGFGGPSAPASIPIVDGFEGEIRGETFFMKKIGHGWWRTSRRRDDGSIEDLIEFGTRRYEPEEFIGMNYYISANPQSPFQQFIMVNLRTETGSLALTVDKLTIRDGGEVTEIPVPDPETLTAVLKKYYGITFPEE